MSMHTTLMMLCDLEVEHRITEITNVIHDLPGIDTVVVALETGVISVEHSPLVSEADIRQALEEAGYDGRQ